MPHFSLPLTYAKYPGKSVVALATMFLSATPKLHRNHLSSDDKITGLPVLIAKPEKSGRFRAMLHNEIIRHGTSLVKLLEILEMLGTAFDKRAFQPRLCRRGKQRCLDDIAKCSRMLSENIARANTALNKVVEQFRVSGFAPFKPGGASHIDFVLEKRLEQPRPGRYTYHLYLDIQFNRK